MAHVLSLDGGGRAHDEPKSDLLILRKDCYFSLGLPGTLRLIKNSNEINCNNSLLATGSAGSKL